MAGVARGELAPDFELEGTEPTGGGRRRYRLADYRGRPVVLVFYPGDDTPVCTVQLNRYTEEFPALDGTGAQVLALSPQSVESHERFSARQGGFAFPLLADLDKVVGRSYGIVGPLGFYRRSAFVVDREGVVRWSSRSITGLSYPSPVDLAEAVKEAED
ncbi:MAG: redoxin domain-containing protein [Acidimicrobiia bacterium]|nr:redoxin domain-containing protein [Acidimicrobiia bacterium]